MRLLLTILTAAFVVGGISLAQAEKRTFIISNDADDYGVDRCLASGASCGNQVATAYCQSREFHSAVSFRKVVRDEITAAIPTMPSCHRVNCDDFVAIECTR